MTSKPTPKQVTEATPSAEHHGIAEGTRPRRSKRGRWVTAVCCVIIAVVLYVMASGPYLGFLAYASTSKGWIRVDTANTLGAAYEPLGWAADASPAVGRLIADYVVWWMDVYGVGAK